MRVGLLTVAPALVLLLAGAAGADDPAAEDVREVFRFQDPAIGESSALVDLGSLMVTINDSGDGPYVYTIDPATGETVGRTDYGGDAVDVEALAPSDATHVWVGDIGDNDKVRSGVKLYRVPVGRGDRTVRVAKYQLRYPDGAHDAESLLMTPDRAYVVTKSLLGSGIYATDGLLHTRGVNMLTQVGHTDEYATDAALLPGGRSVVIRGYADATVATFPAFSPVERFTLPAQPQGEGISVGPGGRVRLCSEGVNSLVLQVTLPAPPSSLTGLTMSGSAAGSMHDSPALRSWPVYVGVLALAGLALTLRRRRR